jgi:hypothetical protein
MSTVNAIGMTSSTAPQTVAPIAHQDFAESLSEVAAESGIENGIECRVGIAKPKGNGKKPIRNALANGTKLKSLKEKHKIEWGDSVEGRGGLIPPHD